MSEADASLQKDGVPYDAGLRLCVVRSDNSHPGINRFFDAGVAKIGASCDNCARPLSCGVTEGRDGVTGARCINWRII